MKRKFEDTKVELIYLGEDIITNSDTQSLIDNDTGNGNRIPEGQ